jgi:aminocarboxymuconate-semialdehyde decarboxylase
MPPSYLEAVKRLSPDAGRIKRVTGIRTLWDMEARLAMLEEWPDVQQVLTLGLPPPEQLAVADLSPEIARDANVGMAEICARWPQRFPAFVAALPMNNAAAALEEMDRAIEGLGARGIQLYTNVNDRPLDDPEFWPVFERITERHHMPVWLHPIRTAQFSDYRAEAASRFEIFQVLGWPYETSVAMARIVFSGLFDRLPGVRVITHHCGGVIPFLGGRADTMWAQLGSRTPDDSYAQVLQKLAKSPLDYFRMFYGDTALGGSASALRCGLDFFGADRVVFGSDCPFDPEGGPMFIREGIRSIEELALPEDVRQKIYAGNARNLLGLRESALSE